MLIGFQKGISLISLFFLKKIGFSLNIRESFEIQFLALFFIDFEREFQLILISKFLVFYITSTFVP